MILYIDFKTMSVTAVQFINVRFIVAAWMRQMST